MFYRRLKFILSTLLVLLVNFAFGQNWTPQTTGLSLIIKSVDFANSEYGFAVTVHGGSPPQSKILLSDNGGATWAYEHSGTVQDLLCISVVSETHAWASGETGTIIHTENGFQSWDFQTAGGNWDLFGIDFIDENEGWATGDGGIVLHTVNGGSDWNIQPTPIGIIMKSIDFTDNMHGWAAGTACTIMHTSNGGASWEIQDTPSNLLLYDIKFVDDLHGWAVGNAGLILHTEDGGERWVQQTSGTSMVLYSVDFIDEDYGFACGNGGTILYTSDDGETWELQESGVNSALWGIDYLDTGNAWCCGNLGVMLKYSPPVIPDVTITLIPEDSLIYIMVYGGTFTFEIIVENNEDYTVNCDVWTDALMPNGRIYGPIILNNLELEANSSISRELSQYVPGIQHIPYGWYTYHGYVGDYPDDIWDSDQFQFHLNS